MRYDAEGQLKIFDFGLAKLGTNPGTKVLYYSDGFTAPESFKKDNNGLHTFDYSLDVYSFGCVSVWMLNEGALPPEMSGLNPHVPHGFDFQSLPLKVSPSTASILLRCLDSNPQARPTMSECKGHLESELLRDQHKMALTSNNGQLVLDHSRRSASVSGNGSSIDVVYDGLSFRVSGVSGNVAINNSPAFVGQVLLGSTVIVLRGNGYPLSVTCDVSHPEVML